MNLCVVSTFDCTVDDFRAVVKEMEEEMRKVCSEWMIAEVNEHKAATLCNLIDLEGCQELMASASVVDWDRPNNSVDVIDSLEQMG